MQKLIAHTQKIVLVLCILALVIVLVTCKQKTDPVTKTTTVTQVDVSTLDSDNYTWDIPVGFSMPIVPENNPMTEAKVELGRHLFYDKRLSGNGEQSCSSCHQHSLAFSDGLKTSIGSTGETLPRNAPSLTNVAYNGTLGWANPELIHLQDQILIPMFADSPTELGITDEDEILERFKSNEHYQQLFQKAYPNAENPITIRRIILAITSFTRTLISGNSPFDQYVFQNNSEALSEASIRGMRSFSTERSKCIFCHGGFNLADSTIHQDNLEDAEFIRNSFHNIGLYNLDGDGAYPTENQGLFEFSEDIIDMGKFRAPSLRNVALTAPYFHDGSAKTLEDVISVYEAGGRVITEGKFAGNGQESHFKSDLVHSINFTNEERQDLISFLESLSDSDFINNPKFSNPFE